MKLVCPLANYKYSGSGKGSLIFEIFYFFFHFLVLEFRDERKLGSKKDIEYVYVTSSE